MLEVQVTQTATKLMEALEKMGQSAGSDLWIDGLSGSPSEELVKAFQEAMNAPETKQPEGLSLEQNDQSLLQEVQTESLQPIQPGPAESMPPVQQSEAISQDFYKQNISLNIEGQPVVDDDMDRLKELVNVLEKSFQPGNTISPVDLYRVQYLTGMFKVHSQTGLNVSQQTSQNIESLLRQQG